MTTQSPHNFQRSWPAERAVTLGGRAKPELREQLRQASVSLNKYAEELFASELFIVSETCYSLNIVETSVESLGFPQGASMPEIQSKAANSGLGLCPLELGPCLRLEYRDQPEGKMEQLARTAQAPTGSITVVSASLVEDDAFPKGFYLRRIDGVLWLRGYRSSPIHRWSSNDRLVFVRI